MWACSRGWADLERNVPLGPQPRFPALTITTLVTSTAVLRLVAEGAVALDDPVNGHLRSLRLADDAVTVRELLAHTGGVDSPSPLSLWADSVADVADVLGPVAGCSGPRGEFAYSYGGYAVLGQLITDLTGTPFAQAATRLVLEPLGMADSWFPAQAPVSPDAARGYRLHAGRLLRARTAAGVRAAERGRAVVDRAGPGSLWVRLADAAARGTRRAGAAPAGPQRDSAAEIGSRLAAAAPDGCRRPGRGRAGFVGLADHAPEHGPHQRCADQPAGPRPEPTERRADPLGRLSTARPGRADGTACTAGRVPWSCTCPSWASSRQGRSPSQPVR